MTGLVIASCGQPTTSAGGSEGPEDATTAGDTAGDTTASDVATGDVPKDDAASADAGKDAAQDTATDAATDTATDTATDSAVDVAPDVQTDVAEPEDIAATDASEPMDVSDGGTVEDVAEDVADVQAPADTVEADAAPDAAPDADNADTATDVTAPVLGALSVAVLDPGGLPIADATVVLKIGTATTDATGVATFPKLYGTSAPFAVHAAGYAVSGGKTELQPNVTTSVTVTLVPVQKETTIVAAETSKVSEGPVAVVLPPNAFLDQSGAAVTGNIDVAVATIDPTSAGLANVPGVLQGTPTGTSTVQSLEPAFVADVSFTQNGAPIQLITGTTAQLTFVLPDAKSGEYTVGQKMAAWYFDVLSGTWVQDGEGVVGDDGAGHKTFTAQVTHFTWWMGALPASESGCASVTVRRGGVAVQGVQVTATSSGVAKSTTDSAGYACVETKAGAPVTVSVVDPLTQLAQQASVVAASTVLACSAAPNACQVITIDLPVPSACVSGDPCDDGNACTADACDTVGGNCAHTPANGVACTDGSACTSGDVCAAGNCTAGAPVDCADGNACTADACAALTGCTHTATTNACDDGDACTTNDVCAGSACVGGPSPAVCGDSVCACGETEANCAADCVVCKDDDGDGVTTCAGDCNDSNAQTNPFVVEVCDGKDNNCNGATDEQDAIGCVTYFKDNDADGYGSGATKCLCGPTANMSPASNDCNDADPNISPAANEACDSVDNNCDGVTDSGCGPCGGKANGALCDDGNACSTGDTCNSDVCAGVALDCNDGNACTSETCDAAMGCMSTPNTSACDDGNVCTAGDVCGNTTCIGGPAIDCNDANPCTADTCSAAMGCLHTAVANGTSCGANLFCVGNVCQ